MSVEVLPLCILDGENECRLMAVEPRSMAGGCCPVLPVHRAVVLPCEKAIAFMEEVSHVDL